MSGHNSEILQVWFPDHLNKMYITGKRVILIFWFPSACRKYIYTLLCLLKWVRAMYLQNNIYNSKRNFIAKKKKKCYHLNLQQVIIFLLVDGLASQCWWLLTDQSDGWWRLGCVVISSFILFCCCCFFDNFLK